ncbi:3-beta-hydroxysteroid dehydrogenase [Rhizodiscina lignyota]|uniref:3-beta-hydroxysteroid dehydrogenase n=1 Tax=Rhizodiscina lignyota TaxID=1504668 RepID=A0A9P4MET2_9PEZI|nr:3-beta-hydroxysteroid dehydrogenase [Rhizodiscina lignyota]
MASKVALITGGASGMGLEVARSLSSEGWRLSILDMNQESGEKVAKSLDAKFYKVNVTNYDELADAFEATWQEHGRLDFVFANAGIAGDESFYSHPELDSKGRPKKPNLLVTAINIDGVISTCWLAQHYFRMNKKPLGGVIVITASCGGIYPVPISPIYGASKHAMVGFMRSIAPRMIKDSIRVNCICPGTVRTGLLSKEGWETYPNEAFTPIEKVVEVVNLFVEDETLYGKAAEIIKNKHYWQDAPPYSDEWMALTMKACD